MGYRESDFASLEVTLVQTTVLRAVRWPDRARILEIGVGSGQVTDFLSGLGHEVHCVDVTEACLAKVRSTSHRYLHDLNRPPLPFEEGSFDCAVMFEVVEHLWNPIAALLDVRRVIRPDGFLLISTPNVNWMGVDLMLDISRRIIYNRLRY